MRQTSIDAYNEIKESGVLGKTKWAVYEYVYKNGPCSIKECTRYLNSDAAGTYTSRFSELESMDAIVAVGKKICQYSGRTVTIWNVTKNIPTKIKKAHRTKCTYCSGRGYKEQGVLL